MKGESLSTPQFSIGWTDGPSDSEHSAVSLKHDESGILIRQPAQRGKGNHAIRADHHEPLQAVTDSRQSESSALGPDSVLNKQVSSIDTNLDAVSKECDYAVSK